MASPVVFLNEDMRFLESIRKGDDEALVQLFERNRGVITAYILRNNGTVDDAEDVLQDAVIVLWERIRSGNFELTAKMSTFLYAVAKNLWLRRLAVRRRDGSPIIDPDSIPAELDSPLDTMVQDETTEGVRRAMAAIGEQCRKLLVLFYWEEQTMEEIAVALGFANADTAKAKKYQCKKALERAIRGGS